MKIDGDSSRLLPNTGACEVVQANGARVRAGGESQPAPTAESWPTLAPEAPYGLAGEIVRAVGPYSEADDVAALAHILVAVGNMVGPGPHACVQYDRHPARLNAVLVGSTAKARKGLAWSTPRHLLARVDDAWAQARITSGLSSGEGLIYRVRDPREEQQPIKEKGHVVGYDAVITDEGVEDKRLLIIEPEFAVTLKHIDREGNILSGIIRQAWDTGDLSTLTKNSPVRATGAHVSIIGHTTVEEARRYLSETERANGFANRFLWLLVRRSKVLPEGEPVPEAVLVPFVHALAGVKAFAATVGEIRRDDDARELWAAVYGSLSEGKPGLLGAITSRAEVQVLRLSVTYALLDCSGVIRPPHLKAALAVWDYAEASARLIFGDRLGNLTADRILAAIRSAGDLTETSIYELFGRHKGKADIQAALALLLELGLAYPETRQTGGRPARIWRDAKKAN